MIHLESLAAIQDWSKQSSGKHNNVFLLKLTLFPTFCNQTASQYEPFLSAIANLRNELLASCPFVCPHGTTRLTPDVFSCNSVLVTFIKIRSWNINFVQRHGTTSLSDYTWRRKYTCDISLNSSRNEKFQTKAVMENKTHVSYPSTLFPNNPPFTW